MKINETKSHNFYKKNTLNDEWRQVRIYYNNLMILVFSLIALIIQLSKNNVYRALVTLHKFIIMAKSVKGRYLFNEYFTLTKRSYTHQKKVKWYQKDMILYDLIYLSFKKIIFVNCDVMHIIDAVYEYQNS